MKPALLVATVGEAATGLALLLFPSLVGQLLFGAPMTDALTLVAARVAGIALLGLSAACWWESPLVGMLAYSIGITALLGFVGLAGGMTGALLWPVVVVHAGLSTALAFDFAQRKKLS